MNRRDFLKITGCDRQSATYLPIAFLLRAGYGCAGYYNSDLNQGIEEMCVLLNARIISLGNRATNREQSAIGDFNDFLEEIVAQLSKTGGDENPRLLDAFGKSIPLTAVPFQEISVLYPVAQIGRMMRSLRKPEVLTEPVDEADLKIEITPGITPGIAAGNIPTRNAPTPGNSSDITPPKPAPAKRPAATPAPVAAKAPAPQRPAGAKVITKPQPAPAHEVSTFFDFDNKSVVLQALRTKLW